MKTVIELAKEAGLLEVEVRPEAEVRLSKDALERFAALVRAEREWIDLTDDEVNKLIQAWHKSDDGLFDYASAVIAAFKEKNK